MGKYLPDFYVVKYAVFRYVNVTELILEKDKMEYLFPVAFNFKICIIIREPIMMETEMTA